MTRFDVRPVTRTCRKVLERGDHALIGVSAGNGYFSQERLGALLGWAGGLFSGVDILYVDTHIDTMYAASGCTSREAVGRAKAAVKDVRRRIRRALETVEGSAAVFTVRALSQCLALPGYQAVQRCVEERIGPGSPVMRACEEQVREIVHGRSEDTRAPGTATGRMQAGLAYMRAELPFLLDTPRILEVPSSVTCYHRLMPVVSEVYRDPGGLGRNPNQGFVVVRPAGAPNEPTGENR